MRISEDVSESLSFRVYGHPQTQGNKTAFPFRRKDGTLGVNVREGRTKKSNEMFQSWRTIVAEGGRIAFGDRPLLKGPIAVNLVFYMPRPKSHFRTGKYSEELKNSAPKWHTAKRYDREKLARAVFDALTHVIWEDDGQVCAGFTSKVYDGRPGAQIDVIELVPPGLNQIKTAAKI